MGGNTDALASFTSMCSSPSLRARMLYPVLCQSIMILLPRILAKSHTSARVGILGGFYMDISIKFFKEDVQ